MYWVEQGMKIVINKEELESHVVDLLRLKYQTNKIIVGPLFESHRSPRQMPFVTERMFTLSNYGAIEPCGSIPGMSKIAYPYTLNLR